MFESNSHCKSVSYAIPRPGHICTFVFVVHEHDVYMSNSWKLEIFSYSKEIIMISYLIIENKFEFIFIFPTFTYLNEISETLYFLSIIVIHQPLNPKSLVMSGNIIHYLSLCIHNIHIAK